MRKFPIPRAWLALRTLLFAVTASLVMAQPSPAPPPAPSTHKDPAQEREANRHDPAFYSESISSAIELSTSPLTSVAKHGAQMLRKSYEQVFIAQSSANDPLFYKKAFGQTCIEKLDNIFQKNGHFDQHDVANDDVNPGEFTTLNISILGNNYIFDMLDKPVVFLGRGPLNEVAIPQIYRQISRVHIIFYYFARTNKLLLVDCGSLHGISLLQREHAAAAMPSSTVSPPSSSSAKPTVIELDGGERALIQLGDVKMTINPKLCTVCMDRPRSCRFLPCGHFAVCDRCASHFEPKPGTKCPICRGAIERVQGNEHGLESHVVEPRP